MYTDYDVIIVGSGVAGLAAGIYVSRAGLNVVVMEKSSMGGELMNRQLIENYPGFADGIQGPELAAAMLAQAEKSGVEFMNCEVQNIKSKNRLHTVYTNNGIYTSKAVIAATGSHPRLLNVQGEAELTGKGVFYCATCDGPLLAGKSIVVAGGGDSGVSEALHLANLGCKVTILVSKESPKASAVLLTRVEENPNVHIICNAKITEIKGNDWVSEVVYEDIRTKVPIELEVEGVLVRIGMRPNTGFLKDVVECSENGQIQVTEEMASSKEGIFAVGDIRAHSPAQIGAAGGDGIIAAMTAVKYIQML
ncbi:thioredoxin reductase (NADPH) [Lachnospiraceae bacterium PM6-15]|uniref:NAD(P)/FAD-dependent oxidoreductase n=1 Tax=Ohessyouella blattaphilus TaxID=2949333 RepID=UPI003E2C5320